LSANPAHNDFPSPDPKHVPENAMTDAELYAGLNEIFRQVLDDGNIVLSPEMTADDVEGWDSMNHIFIVVEIEKRFGVKFQAAERRN
jgi:acyl carrier protein